MTDGYFMSNFDNISGCLECDRPNSINWSNASLPFWILLSSRPQVVVLTAHSLTVYSLVLSSGFSGVFSLISSSPSSFSSTLSVFFAGFGTNWSTAIAFQAAKIQGVAWNAKLGKFSAQNKLLSENVLDGFKVFQHFNEHFSVMEEFVQGTFV